MRREKVRKHSENRWKFKAGKCEDKEPVMEMTTRNITQGQNVPRVRRKCCEAEIRKENMNTVKGISARIGIPWCYRTERIIFNYREIPN